MITLTEQLLYLPGVGIKVIMTKDDQEGHSHTMSCYARIDHKAGDLFRRKSTKERKLSEHGAHTTPRFLLSSLNIYVHIYGTINSSPKLLSRMGTFMSIALIGLKNRVYNGHFWKLH